MTYTPLPSAPHFHWCILFHAPSPHALPPPTHTQLSTKEWHGIQTGCGVGVWQRMKSCEMIRVVHKR